MKHKSGEVELKKKETFSFTLSKLIQTKKHLTNN